MNNLKYVTGGAIKHATAWSDDGMLAAGYKPLMWLMALLLAAVVAGCGGSSGTAAPAAGTPPPGGSKAAVDLKSILTNNFVILGTTGITEATPASGVITGNIGVSPTTGASITVLCSEMQPASSVASAGIHTVDAGYRAAGYAACGVDASPVIASAVADLKTAYTAASDPATPAATGAANLNVLNGVIPAGTNFPPGTYTWGTGVSINGDITLSGSASDNWIFQMSGVLAVKAGPAPSGGAKVLLSGGALPSHVFWQVAGSTATLGTYSTLSGNILGSPTTSIAIQTGAVLHGRALAGTSVGLDGNKVGP